ncbi:retrovirus-related pol polyprotein from transposon TNT 1-94 [Tanacetum coccineum]
MQRPDYKGYRDSQDQSHHHLESKLSEEDTDPTSLEDKDAQKNLALIAKYFKKIYKPTNNNLRTSSNTRNKNVDTTPSVQSGKSVFKLTREFGHYAKLEMSTTFSSIANLTGLADHYGMKKLMKQRWKHITVHDNDRGGQQHLINESIRMTKRNSMDTKFDKPSVVRQPNAQRILKPSVLGKRVPFLDSLKRKKFTKKKSVSITNESKGLSKLVTPQNLPRTVTQANFLISTSTTINVALSKKDVVIGLPKLKYVKNQLCSSCEVSKAKRSSFKSKTVPSSKGRLNLLHMDLCGLMRVASINGKKYILVIVDDYSRYTWTLFLRSKDETPEVLKLLTMLPQRNIFEVPIISVRNRQSTEFLNKTLNAFFKEEGIEHQTSTPRTPEQNGVVER